MDVPRCRIPTAMVLMPGSLSVARILPRLMKLRPGFAVSVRMPIVMLVALAPAIEG